jgi:DNA excision repair protein ERCC-6-like 2
MYVQKLSNHIAMIIPRISLKSPNEGNDDPLEKKEKDRDLIQIALPELSDFLCAREPLLNYADPELCGKWKVLDKLLQHWYREGSKVLIFSYSVRLLKMLDHLMVRKGYMFCTLEGSMDLPERISFEIVLISQAPIKSISSIVIPICSYFSSQRRQEV